MIKLQLTGTLPPDALKGLKELSQDIFPGSESESIAICAKQGKHLHIYREGDTFFLEWEKTIQFYRGLSLISANRENKAFSANEDPSFRTMGVMLDQSRNGVLKPEAVCYFIRKMALMGLNLLMLYTEDTYEIPDLPYFGYMRGRYTARDLRAIDDYACLFGIEVCPCIQTLAHLNRVLHWPAMAHLKDTEEVILAEDESALLFIEEMIIAAAKPFRSRRIHIGMDEASDLGQGNYFRRHGYKPKHEIIQNHLKGVKKILDRHGLHAMMWSDMYFRPFSPGGGYYDAENIPTEVFQEAPESIDLVYWDYYHESISEYSHMMELHNRFAASTIFAGSIWNFSGPVPDYHKTLATLLPAIEACRMHHIEEMFVTVWGDNGAESNQLAALAGMQLMAEYLYTGKYCPAETAKRFEVCCHGNYNAFMESAKFNTPPGMRSGLLRPANPAKFMLYQDPLIQLYEDDVRECCLSEHYRDLAVCFAQYAGETNDFTLLMQFYASLANVLRVKCDWHEHSSSAVKNRDTAAAQALVDSVEDILEKLSHLKSVWRKLWESSNRTYGFEVIDLRIGGLAARFHTARERMQAFASGHTDDIPELSETILPYIRLNNGELFGSYAYGEIVSAGKINL